MVNELKTGLGRSRAPVNEWLPSKEELSEAENTTVNKSFNVNLRVRPERVTLKHVAWMSEKLATTQASGLPTYRALGMLGRMRDGDVLGRRLLELQEKMAEGRSLADGMRDREAEFGPLACALVEAGEASGSLERNLSKIASLSSARLRLRRKVRSALTYPISVVVIAIGLIAALLVYVVPTFAGVYSDAGGTLPLLTRLILVASDYAPYVGAALLGLALALFLTLRSAKTNLPLRRKVDVVKLRIPLIGPLLEKGVNARIAATLSNLLAAGVPLLEALGHAAEVAGNTVFSEALVRVRTAVADGATFSSALDGAGVFPELFVQLAVVGEESGSLPTLMENYALTSEEELEAATETLTSLIEPLMMVVIGGIVGVFLLGLYLPMLDIGSQIK